MRRKLQAKLNSKKGFTLVELLIVVAIIAILVAISIPMVTGSLNRARIATDQANERAARAAVTIAYLLSDNAYSAGDIVYYNAETGEIQDTRPTVGYGQCNTHNNQILRIDFTAVGDSFEYQMQWVDTDGATGSLHETHGIDG